MSGVFVIFRLLVVAILLSCASCYADTSSKEGFITINIPHPDCLDGCTLANLYRKGHLLSSIKLQKQQPSISFSGLSDGRYSVRFGHDSVTKKFVVKKFEVNHYSLGTAVKVFVLGLLMFLVLLVVLFQRVKGDKRQ